MNIMPRLVFPSNYTQNNFLKVVKATSNLDNNSLSLLCGVSCRTFRDWSRGKYNISQLSAEKLSREFGVVIPSDIKIVNDYWYVAKGARKGALKRLELYGPLGTTEGRRRGGLNSQKTHRLKNTRFYNTKTIFIPRRTARLAEIIGALMGDGGISSNQVKIYLNLKTDILYADYLKKQIEKLFRIKVTTKENVKESLVVLCANGVKLVVFLNRLGLPIGNKIVQELDIPQWIYLYKSWQRACLRGLLDTDGCTYIDRHTYKHRKYRHLGIAYTSYSPKLLKSIASVLSRLGYSPTLTTKNRVLLRKQVEIFRFFREIKPSNRRHHAILNKFLEECRESG